MSLPRLPTPVRAGSPPLVPPIYLLQPNQAIERLQKPQTSDSGFASYPGQQKSAIEIYLYIVAESFQTVISAYNWI